ncbi:MAG: hypothetical protein L6Q84_05905 [Polyangiaceae bacterium]|nr:hypothetical protein [Polyangiaceae bacterium]
MLDIRQSRLDKVDLLFMIDNSLSMGDKQAILAEAVPELLKRVVTPKCQDDSGKLTDPPCAPNAHPEFRPVEDIHIGIVSSSLGGHGGNHCSATGPNTNPTQNDRAHLIATVRGGMESYGGLGFLWWDPLGKKGPAGPGENDASALAADFAVHVKATGEKGCGYEAQLESWYRFLIDPAPPAEIEVVNGVAQTRGVDEVILQQRRDFLRPDSLVTIVMLSDENDCSIVDGGVSWLAAQTSHPDGTPFLLPRGASACAQDPDHICCRPCDLAEKTPPAGCPTLAADPECQKGAWNDQADHPNLRCWQQKRRFGVDFLYPTRRYVEALSQYRICPVWDAHGPVGCQYEDEDAPGYRVCNPLFRRKLDDPESCEKRPRDPSLVFLAGIVGVPWQDIATDDTLSDPKRLTYLSANQLAEKDRWRWLLPDCARTVDQNLTDPGSKLPRPTAICDRWDALDQPDDALMVESSDPRSGVSPALNAALANESAGFMANPINGHERLTSGGDLQYACIFPLSQPKDCSAGPKDGCDCDDVGPGYTQNDPVCQQPSGEYTRSQGWAKAFPGTRELQVLRDFGEGSIAASICPKIFDKTNPDFGYNPAVGAIIERLKPALSAQCLSPPISFPLDAAGDPDPSRVPRCVAVELEPSDSPGSACAPCDGSTGREPVRAELRGPVMERLEDTGQCQGGDCEPNNFCMCEIAYVKDRQTCEQTGPQLDNYGWCFVDPSQGVGNPALVERCHHQRLLIFSGLDTPKSGATVFLACATAPR